MDILSLLLFTFFIFSISSGCISAERMGKVQHFYIYFPTLILTKTWVIQGHLLRSNIEANTYLKLNLIYWLNELLNSEAFSLKRFKKKILRYFIMPLIKFHNYLQVIGSNLSPYQAFQGHSITKVMGMQKWGSFKAFITQRGNYQLAYRLPIPLSAPAQRSKP